MPNNSRNICVTQFYDFSRQCGRPVGAQCSIGFGRYPLINGVKTILLTLFFFKIPDLVHRRTLAPVAAGNRR